MIYCLDTNTVVHYLRGTSAALFDRLQRETPHVIKIPSLVRAELLVGAAKSARPDENRVKVETFLNLFDTIPFDHGAADHYARVRLKLEQAGTPIGPNDLVIATTVLTVSATLVTNNTREFARVPGLVLEDWLLE